MDNKIQNLVLKGITGLIILLGVLFTVWVMQGGSPSNMGDEEMDQLAIKEAIELGKDASLSQVELDTWIYTRGREIKAEREEAQFGNVSTIIDFTVWIIYLVVFAIIVSFLYMFTVDMKKAIFSLLGIVGIVAFMLIIYYSVGDSVPEELVAKESLKGLEEDKLLFTPGNWRIASAAVLSTAVLAIIALVGWIGGEVSKVFR